MSPVAFSLLSSLFFISLFAILGTTRARAFNTSLSLPRWDEEEVWTPIELEQTNKDGDATVILCKLAFKRYYTSPSSLSKFGDLVAASSCKGSNRKTAKVSVLMKELEEQQALGLSSGIIVPPTGFVFHESRVGSTLVANLLASDPFSIVYSESKPIAQALQHCRKCTRETQVQLVKDIVTLMGRSPIHSRLFFKLQSIATTNMAVILQAFPTTPWAFIYRKPVQTMMSHLDPKKGGGTGAPCLRSRKRRELTVVVVLENNEQGNGNGKENGKGKGEREQDKAWPKEAWCAAHLSMLCYSAYNAYNRFSKLDFNGSTRGLLVNYESLPGFVPKGMLPLFIGTKPDEQWLRKMEIESTQYSKSRGRPRPFTTDSEDKDRRATDLINRYAGEMLLPIYTAINTAAQEALRATMPAVYKEVVVGVSGVVNVTGVGGGVDWGRISGIR